MLLLVGVPFNLSISLLNPASMNNKANIVLLQLDAAAPVLAALKQRIVIAKVNAEKFSRLAEKYEVEYGLCFQFLLNLVALF